MQITSWTKNRCLGLFLPKPDVGNGEIYPFYSFRFIAFILIFLTHASDVNLVPMILRESPLGVTFFILVSGFLNGYNRKDSETRVGIGKLVSHTVKKMSKFYKLHVFMFFVTMPRFGVFNIADKEDFYRFFKSAISNLTLTQSWINDGFFYFGYNGVTWFLSVFLFLSAMTPILQRAMVKINRSSLGTVKLCIAAFTLFLLSTFLVFHLKTTRPYGDLVFYAYIFPPTRLIDYLIGMIAGFICAERIAADSEEKKFWRFSILELATIAATVLTVIWVRKTDNAFFWSGFNAYIIPVIAVMTVFVQQRGLFSFLLSNKATVFFGKIAMYSFLIHQPLLNYMSLNRDTAYQGCLALYMLILTMIISAYLYKHEKGVFKRRDMSVIKQAAPPAR